MPEVSGLVHACLLLVVQSFRLLGKVLSSWYGRLQVKCKLVMLCDCQGGLNPVHFSKSWNTWAKGLVAASRCELP